MIRTFLVAVVLVAWAATSAAQSRYIDGVFIHAGGEPIELLTFADRTSSGQLRLSSGSWEDVPIVESVRRVLCSLPNWKPSAVWLSTKRIFRDEYAERRVLPFAVRQLNIYAVELRVADMETPESASRFVRAVGATDDDPALLVVTMSSMGMTRDYVVQLVATP